MSQKIQVFLAVIVGLILGFIGGQIPSVSNQSVQIQKLQAQIEQAKKFFPPVPQEVRSISGTVKEMRGSMIVVEVSAGNPFDESPRMRTVTIGKDTKIVRLEQKDSALVQQEFAAFQKALQSLHMGTPSGVPLVQPTPFREVPAELSDIKPGQQVTITAGENIRDKESFGATRVSFSVSPVSQAQYPPIK